MAYNASVKLIGNTGAKAKVIERKKLFATFSLATTDSYKDKDENWQKKETQWHDVIVFNPKLIEIVRNYEKGTRLEVTGSLTNKFVEVFDEGGKSLKIRTTRIVAGTIKEAPLPKTI